MKVEVVIIGTELLANDVLDTNSPYISRCLREVHATLICRVIVGDDVEMITHVLQTAVHRADVVLTTGGMGYGANDVTRQAVARVTGRELVPGPPGIAGATILAGEGSHPSGLLLEQDNVSLMCLPGSRQDMAYVLETAVLPLLKEKLAAATTLCSGWLLLRTVGVMESSLKQQLVDLPLGPKQRITYDSFAGQTNIRLWVEAETDAQVQHELGILRRELLTRLGENIFGEGDDRLEDVILRSLLQKDIRLSIAECYTEQIFARTLARLPQSTKSITFVPTETWQELAKHLDLHSITPDQDLTNWCRTVSERLLHDTKTDICLVIYSNVTQGGVQLLVTLASSLGVSVTQRSFGGHPENIQQWACTLGLTHLRRWLMVHG